MKFVSLAITCKKKLNSPNLVKKLINKSGVRAEILSSGYIEVGSKIIKIK